MTVPKITTELCTCERTANGHPHDCPLHAATSYCPWGSACSTTAPLQGGRVGRDRHLEILHGGQRP